MAAVALMVIEVRHLGQRDPLEQTAHVIERVDGHADLAHLARRHGVVGVVAHLGGEVEGHGQPGLTGIEQRPEPPVGLLGGAEPGVLPHRPGAAPVHGGMGAAGEGVLPRVLDGVGQVGGAIHHLDVDAASGGAPLLAEWAGGHLFNSQAGRMSGPRRGYPELLARPQRQDTSDSGIMPPAPTQYSVLGSQYWPPKAA